MINYFKYIFTAPEYQLSTLDKLVQIFIIFIGVVIIYGSIFLISRLVDKIKRNHRKKKELKGNVEDVKD